MNNIHIPPVVKNILIINVIFFIATMVITRIDLGTVLGVYYFDSPRFGFWQPITYMFMHGGFMHIFFNMYAVFMFGSVLEQRWGAKRFINFYLITGLGALALQWAVQAFEVYQITGSAIDRGQIPLDLFLKDRFNPALYSMEKSATLASVYFTPMVGASGAVFGLLVAFAMLYPNVELYIMFIPVPVKVKYVIPVYVVLELFLGVGKFQGDSVAHFAHIGGALIGFLLVKLWKDNNRFYDYYE